MNEEHVPDGHPLPAFAEPEVSDGRGLSFEPSGAKATDGTDTVLMNSTSPFRCAFRQVTEEWNPETGPASEIPSHAGRFVLLREIARGGMGIVVKAWDPYFLRFVAIKTLHRHLQDVPELRKRFHHEVIINGRLEHPSIIPIHEKGEAEGGRPFFAMRLQEGATLARQFKDVQGDPLIGFGHSMQVFQKICDGVAYAHSQGVIHRDIKPSNIIVGDFGVVKIVDWGLAKYLDCASPSALDMDGLQQAPASDADSTSAFLVGTPAYLAPEQARNEVHRVDERVDVFGLGAILCQMLTGKGPYPDPTIDSLQQAAAGNLDAAFQLLDASDVDPPIAALAKKCLAPELEERPRNGQVVSRMIDMYLEKASRRPQRDLVRFFDLSPDLFCIAGLDGFFRRINGNFSRLFGRPDNEFLERPFMDFVHPDDRGPTAEAMSSLALGQPVVRFRNRYRHAHGHYLNLEWNAKVETEGRNYIFAVARDVTQQMGEGGAGCALPRMALT